jgi:trans-2,3-dihydro-3-hydroxyanthranilate isomerase
MSSATGLEFEWVDVFAEERYAGNGLAVVRRAATLRPATMQRIARETNLSETTFVLADEPREGAFDVRIFTPAQEIPYAGHPTLGTAWVLRRALAPDASGLALRLGVGEVRVRFDADGLVWLRAPQARFAPATEHERIVRALGLGPDALHPSLPIEIQTTGFPLLVVPLRDAQAVRSCRLDAGAYAELLAAGAPEAIYVFAQGARDPRHQLTVRMFAPAGGVPEDPATGSAAGWLGHYLARHQVLGKREFAVKVEQGHEIGRPSLLHVHARWSGEALEVEVGGRVIPVLRGVLA